MTAEQAISWLSLKPKDLPVFVLIATDPLALAAIDRWGIEAMKAGVPLGKMVEAGNVRVAFQEWPDKKLPG